MLEVDLCYTTPKGSVKAVGKVLFQKLNVDYIFYPAVTGELTPTRPSLLGPLVEKGG
jgi:hypothetical protein